MHPTWSSGHSEVAHACCISRRSHPIRESSAMRIGVRQGSGLVLVEEKCRSYSYKGGWHQWTGEAGERLGCAGIHTAQQFLPIIQPSLDGLIWGVTGPSTVLSNCPLKARRDGDRTRITVAHIPINMGTVLSPSSATFVRVTQCMGEHRGQTYQSQRAIEL